MNILRVIGMVALMISVAIVGAGCLSSAQGNIKEEPLVATVKVLAYNIHHGVGEDGKLDLKRIADVIREAEADIVGLNEVDKHWGARSEYVDQAKELANLLGMHYAYGENLDVFPELGRKERRQYGNAILSKYPIESTHNYSLPKHEDKNEQRGLLEAAISVNGARLTVYVTHLGLSSAERLLQTKKILEFTQNKEGPMVFLGDFNTGPSNFEMVTFLKTYRNAFAGIPNAYTFPVAKPTVQADYIIHSIDMTATDQEVINTNAPDHLPVAAQLQWKPQSSSNTKGE